MVGEWRLAWLGAALRNTRRRHGGNKMTRHYCLSAAVSPSPPALSLLTPLWLVLSVRGLALVPVTPALGVSRVGDAGAALSGVVCAAMRPPGCPTIDSFASPATPRHSHTHPHEAVPFTTTLLSTGQQPHLWHSARATRLHELVLGPCDHHQPSRHSLHQHAIEHHCDCVCGWHVWWLSMPGRCEGSHWQARSLRRYHPGTQHCGSRRQLKAGAQHRDTPQRQHSEGAST